MYYKYFQRPPKKAAKKKAAPRWRERETNPDTSKPFSDPRSSIKGGRVICKGADMAYLRERVGEREKEICQGCEAWAPIYPPEGQIPGEMHHRHGRGMGSAKRNDVAVEMLWLCRNCHRKAKIEPMFKAGDES